MNKSAFPSALILAFSAAPLTQTLGVFRLLNRREGNHTTLMDKQQAGWLIVRAFGVYLLIQAFMLGLGIPGEIYTARMYSNLAASLGTQNNYVTALSLSYRSTLVAWLLKFVLYSATGIYLLRRGRFR